MCTHFLQGALNLRATVKISALQKGVNYFLSNHFEILVRLETWITSVCNHFMLFVLFFHLKNRNFSCFLYFWVNLSFKGTLCSFQTPNFHIYNIN